MSNHQEFINYRKRQKQRKKLNKKKYSSAIVISTKIIHEPSFKQRYYNFLKSAVWHDSRKHILDKKGNQCVICEKVRDLHVHHISYDNVFAKRPENTDDIVVICRQHHDEFHKKYGVKHNMKRQWFQFMNDKGSIIRIQKDEEEAGYQLFKNL